MQVKKSKNFESISEKQVGDGQECELGLTFVFVSPHSSDFFFDVSPFVDFLCIFENVPLR